MINKVIKFLRYPYTKKKEVIFDRLAGYIFLLVGAFWFFDRLALSHLPDSMTYAKAYPSVRKLYRRFGRYNKKNNGGDIHRLTSIIFNIEKVILEDKIKGDFAELGVWRGNTASILAFYAKENGRHVHLFDTFEGFDKKDLKDVDSKFSEGAFSNTSVDIVRDVIGKEESECCTFHVGYFPESLTDNLDTKIFSVVSLDADLYSPMKAGLDWFFPRMNHGGLFLLHDYSSKHWDGCKKAIDEFCEQHCQSVILMPDKSGSAFIRVHKK